MKFQRQAKIVDIIENEEIETQEELSERLKALGLETTQATVSRDIKELRVIKLLCANGKYKYATTSHEAESSYSTRLKNIFKEGVTNIDFAQNMVVIKTLPGLGSAAAMAIDAIKITGVVGTIAGDDTVFIVMRDTESAEKFANLAAEMLV